MSTRIIGSAAIVVSGFILGGCSSVPSTYGLDEHSAKTVRQTCTEIMGLRTGPEFEACGGALAETVLNLQDAALTAQADDSCEQQGLTRGSVEQAKCVVMFRRASSERELVASTQLVLVPVAQPWQSYFSLSQAQQDERAELSCAQIGLHPAMGRFWHCVSNLKYAVANIRYETMP
jgi:hypothetical protein